MDMQKTKHFIEMLQERDIKESWVDSTLKQPEKIEDRIDGTKHFLRKIKDYDNRWLRVIINVKVNPNKAITVFFDRRMRGKYEN